MRAIYNWKYRILASFAVGGLLTGLTLYLISDLPIPLTTANVIEYYLLSSFITFILMTVLNFIIKKIN